MARKKSSKKASRSSAAKKAPARKAPTKKAKQQSPRKRASKATPAVAASSAAPAPASAEPDHSALHRPVLGFTALILFVFAALYWIYGPGGGSSWSNNRASLQQISDASQSPTPAPAQELSREAIPLTNDAAAQASNTAQAIQSLQLSFPKKAVTLDENVQAALQPIARYLRETPGAKLEVVGHTCNIGTAEDNDALSLERAEVVREFLIRQGLAAKRVTATGLGEREPIASNSSDAGRIRNRRVEFRLSE